MRFQNSHFQQTIDVNALRLTHIECGLFRLQVDEIMELCLIQTTCLFFFNQNMQIMFKSFCLNFWGKSGTLTLMSKSMRAPAHSTEHGVE